ncbi:MAG: N-6 DNA methylase [Methanolobus sp.]
MKDGQNRLRSQDIHKIVDVFTKQTEVPKYSKIVSLEEIEKNEFNPEPSTLHRHAGS